MDFYRINAITHNGVTKITPEFIVYPTKDLMVRGKEFYAIYDEENNTWSTDIYDVIRLINKDLYKTRDLMKQNGDDVIVNDVSNYSNGVWKTFRDYLSRMGDTYESLDSKIKFSNDILTRDDHCSKKLDYALNDGDHSAWDKLMGTLYEESELQKLEWAIGSIVKGDSVSIQKFFVLYGAAGTGKSTFLKILQDMFEPYSSPFDAKALTSNNQFTTGIFRTNPLICIQHDGDLSRIEDNTKLNSIVSHEPLLINEKYKSEYVIIPMAMLFLGTNSPVRITDAKSGIIRRLIDVSPSGAKLPHEEYDILMSRIKFEHGAIAKHCLDVYEKLGRTFYDPYVPRSMIYKTDFFYNFVEENYPIFHQQEYCTLKQAWQLYKEYCSDSGVTSLMKRYLFREALADYFDKYYNLTRIDGKQIRSVYVGFKADKFGYEETEPEEEVNGEIPEFLKFEEQESIFDKTYGDCPAQLANKNETPTYRWSDVKTKLSEIDTSKTHYVLLSENEIVIDFDLKNSEGEKDLNLNIKEASKWPPTYAELSKSGNGIHLHYIYDGDTTKLSRIFSNGIEVKIFTGLSSLRRKLTKCNNYEIAHISSGLPLKEAKNVLNFDAALSENKLRELITRNINKEFHPGTKPSIDFIYYILKTQYDKGAVYDVSDMAQAVMVFASHSTHHAAYCLKMVNKMKFKSDNDIPEEEFDGDEPYVFFDCEVFPNLFLVNWKYAGEKHRVVRLINPSPIEIEALMKHKLIGFNNLRYDNHMLYACWIGYSNAELYKLSQDIIGKKRDAFFGSAYGISFTDVYDFASAGNKKSLKKWEVELGIHHQELGLPWDQPVPEDMWPKVAEYCDNDVISTEAVFNHLSGDWKTRQTLARLTGCSENTTTNNLTIKFIFGNDKPGLVYTDLATGKQYGPGEPGPYDAEKK